MRFILYFRGVKKTFTGLYTKWDSFTPQNEQVQYVYHCCLCLIFDQTKMDVFYGKCFQHESPFIFDHPLLYAVRTDKTDLLSSFLRLCNEYFYDLAFANPSLASN